MNFHDFQATLLSGDTIKMDSYRGNWVLVVNTASKCGLTPQYEGLEKLYRTWNKEGLVILGFPCNQFGNQEPGSAGAIASFCDINYGVSFPMFARIDVNGSNTHPLFSYLKKELPGIMGAGVIKWNFTKFLVNPHGQPVLRFAPITTPESIENRIATLIEA